MIDYMYATQKYNSSRYKTAKIKSKNKFKFCYIFWNMVSNLSMPTFIFLFKKNI